MFGRFGELFLILLIVFVLFGAGKLPKVMSELGKGLRSFKKGFSEDDKQESQSSKAKKNIVASEEDIK